MTRHDSRQKNTNHYRGSRDKTPTSWWIHRPHFVAFCLSTEFLFWLLENDPVIRPTNERIGSEWSPQPFSFRRSCAHHHAHLPIVPCRAEQPRTNPLPINRVISAAHAASVVATIGCVWHTTILLRPPHVWAPKYKHHLERLQTPGYGRDTHSHFHCVPSSASPEADLLD